MKLDAETQIRRRRGWALIVSIAVGMIAVGSMVFESRNLQADIYKWVDANGVVHFSDKAPEAKGAVKDLQSMPSAPPSPEPPPRAKSDAPTDEKAKTPESKTGSDSTRLKEAKVELYVTSWCKYCTLAKNYLRSKNVAFAEYDVEKDPAAAKRRQELDKRTGVPLALINGTIILGFSEGAYAQALNRR